MKTFRIQVDTKENGTRGKGLQRDRSGRKKAYRMGSKRKNAQKEEQ